MRFSGLSVSGSAKATSAKPMIATMVTATNTARQPKGTMMALPISGARIGDTLKTSMIVDISLVASMPVWRSRMTARGITMHAAAPMPWTKRKKISHSMLGENPAPIPPIANTASPK